jgi:hypothetical protein
MVTILRVHPPKPYASSAHANGRLKKTKKDPPALSPALTASIIQSNRIKANKYRYLRKSLSGTLNKAQFPPEPLNAAEIHRILTTSSMACQPDRFEEDGCAVCGRLTPKHELTKLSDATCSLLPLEVPGVTRKERFHLSDPIEELPGPVLAAGCDHICVECEGYLHRNKLPPNALARHCWIGEVPPVLKKLSYAEGLLIARVRHNRCVIRVNSGRVRMNANAIMFAQPVLKVYLKLPPSRQEMEEVLAVVLTGSCDPTPEDFARMPLLVRRNEVAAALEWLKLNHEHYADLEISEENLLTYPLNDVIVRVDFHRTEGELEHSVPESARSIFDSYEEQGTSTGPCTFAVHGLTGAEYWDAPMSTITSVALQHLTNKGKMLGVGQLDKPESMYNNVAAYPSMFPWLFPYGKGGLGHETHKFILGDQTRKRSLLLYHDKRFQTDMYFPMIAFNHEQLKASSKGSRIIVKRSKFAEVSRRLLSINPDVAGNIADRLVGGENVKPQTEDEIKCFELLRDLDGIGAHVPASATSKKTYEK